MIDVLYTLAPSIVILSALMILSGREKSDPTRTRAIAHNKYIRVFLLLALTVLLARYGWWRISSSLPEFTWSLEGIWSRVYFAAEVIGLIAAATMYVWLMRRTDRHEQANRGEQLLTGGSKPRICILIPTYNEPETILEKTIIGATSQNYDNYAVYVLDDNRRKNIKELCKLHGVGYIDRDSNEGAKAGNLNNGISVIRSRGEFPEYIAVLDADFVAMPNFIRRAVAVAVTDAKIAIVQTPQHFYNPDPLQLNLNLTGHVADEQRYLFDYLMPAHDAWGVAFCCGTSWIGRMEALDAVGGVPTDTVTEDMLLSLKLKEIGYDTVYLNERLTVGLAAESLGEYVSQRYRWSLGFMQIFRNEYNPFSSKHSLDVFNRIAVFQTFYYWSLSFPLRFLLLVCPIIFWVTGVTVFHARIEDLMQALMPWLVLHILGMAWLTSGRLQPILGEINQILLLVSTFHSTIYGLFFNANHKFKVTKKGIHGSDIIINWSLLMPVLVVLILYILSLALAANPHHLSFLDTNIRLINISWLVANTVVLVIAAAACVEVPRRRHEERFDLSERVLLRMHGLTLPGTLLDLSLSGAKVSLPDPVLAALFKAGMPISLEIGQQTRLSARIARSQIKKDCLELGLRFELQELRTRQELVRRTFATGQAATQRFRINSFVVISRILRGAFR